MTAVLPARVDRSQLLHSPEDFRRDGWGRPSVTAPNDFGSQVWYTRPTTMAGTVADRFGIERWRMAQVAVGVGLRQDLAVAAVAFRGDSDRDRLYKLVDEAQSAAGSSASATMGEVKHKLTADVILGKIELDDLTPLLADEITAIIDVEVRSFADIIGVEFHVVNDDVECAGTPDRLYRLPDGRCAIGDLKTGENALAYASQEIAVQLAIYSHGVPYDQRTGKRGSWPDGFDPSTGFVIFAPSGQPPSVHQFDLEAGWEGAALAYYVRKYRKRKVYRPAEDINPPF